ncbi:sodium channel and clathrin linker 1 [Ornithorhynchus anatinus]|uniref:sodium channel and clathrin linker 1 n=1 Tax=Ornithorhynchus anatinus TaxID=9258 RepID=UPI0010A7A39E|nr:sodium channel and clathrin linker 1 [Ornithorhynchus anatinus]
METFTADSRFLAPLIEEFDAHLEEMNGQLEYYQTQMGEMRLKLEGVTKENERLHGALKQAVEKRLDGLPPALASETESFADGETVRNLQEQLQLANQEKQQAVELWQTVSRELARLQRLYREHVSDVYVHEAERQKQKDQLNNFQQLTRKLHVANEDIEATNQEFLKAMTEQREEVEQLRTQLRQTKSDLRKATCQVEALTKEMGDLVVQVQKKEEDLSSAQGREEEAERFSQQLQSDMRLLETRWRAASRDVERFRGERAELEKETQELRARCVRLEQEKYEAFLKVRDSTQLLEEANLQKCQVLFEEKQKKEEIEKMNRAISQILQDAADRTRKEVESTRKLFNGQIARLTEEISDLEMKCGEKQDQIERLGREKRTLEDELAKRCQEGRGDGGADGRLEETQRRCLLVERARDDLRLRLRTTLAKMRQLEIASEEEASRSREATGQLRSALEAEREHCRGVSEQRLQLQQENEQLQGEAEELRRSALEAQRKATLKIGALEHERSAKERGFEAQLREMEEGHRSATEELRRLLVAQQKATNRWKEETKKLTESAEARIGHLKSQLSHQKLHTQDLISQLETAKEKAIESERLSTEHQMKIGRLQSRLNQAEQRAASASQKDSRRGTR